jgi:hypothetical protein
MSNVLAPPRSSQGPIVAGFGARVVGPVLASDGGLLGETVGAAVAAPVGSTLEVTGVDVVAVGAPRTGAGVLAGCVVTTVGAGAAQTWLKRVGGGGAPKAEV